MRYTTSQFNETVWLAGRFAAGATVTIEIIDIMAGAAISLSSTACTSIADSEMGTGGNATRLFRWPSSNFTTQPTAFTQYAFTMKDLTGEIREGKFSLGGHPDTSALSLFDNQVILDTVNGFSGTAFPRGTRAMPVNNLADAKSIADLRGFKKYFIHTGGTPLTINIDHENWEFEGTDPEDDILTVASGTSVDQSVFEQINLRGDITGRIAMRSSIVGVLGSGTTTGVEGTFDVVSFRGSVIRVAPGGTISASRAFSDEISGITFDFNTVAGCKVLLGEFTGIVSFINANQPSGAAAVVAVNANGALVTTASTVTDAVLLFAGVGKLTRSDTINPALVVDVMVKVDHVQRVHNPNVETVLFYATGAIVGRSVPAGGVSHVRLRGKEEAATTFSSPTFTKFVVYAYQSGATVSDAPASATPKDAAPVDGTFTSVTPP